MGPKGEVGPKGEPGTIPKVRLEDVINQDPVVQCPKTIEYVGNSNADVLVIEQTNDIGSPLTLITHNDEPALVVQSNQIDIKGDNWQITNEGILKSKQIVEILQRLNELEKQLKIAQEMLDGQEHRVTR